MTVAEAGKNSREKGNNKNRGPARYQENCSNRACLANQGTICSNGTCSCGLTENWNGKVCDRHLSSCSGKSTETYCSVQGYQCLNNVCECPTGETWNGKFCSRYSAPFTNLRYCLVQGLICESEKCGCPSGTWNETVGFCALSYNQTCYGHRYVRSLYSGEKFDYGFRTQCAPGLYCVKRLRTCQCIRPAVWNGVACA
ncbi:unnamed protein product [Brachionus calyciflorus]|uniref:EGF-like domain-containing protein n=1 Tax=Brachionus calyciflorus TaxID=104777 RepID=A0A814Q1D6_9BILA|nr:unnamed protein product [Brachionus calyciflorus]